MVMSMVLSGCCLLHLLFLLLSYVVCWPPEVEVEAVLVYCLMYCYGLHAPAPDHQSPALHQEGHVLTGGDQPAGDDVAHAPPHPVPAAGFFHGKHR
jgi:hypothetical protein